jgi:hypothetical protein
MTEVITRWGRRRLGAWGWDDELLKGPAPEPTSWSDDFDDGGAGDLATVDAANWTATHGTINQTADGAVVGGAAGDSVYLFEGGAPPADQFSEITIRSMNVPPGTGVYIGSAVRMADDGDGYVSAIDRVSCWIQRQANGVYVDDIADALVTPAAGDVWRLEAEGNTLRLYQNGNLILQGTDNTHAAGKAGLYTEDSHATVAIESWRAGAL